MTRWLAPGWLSRCRRGGRGAVAALVLATAARAGDLQVKSTAGATLATLPGQIVTLSWVLANPTAAPCRLRERYLLPDGWKLAVAGDDTGDVITLAPGASVLRLTALIVPSGVPAADYAVGCSWVDADAPDGPGRAAGRVVVTVQSSSKLELTAGRVPTMAISGEPYTVTLQAVNRGNSTLQVKAAATTSIGCPVTLTPAQFILHPGAVASIIARVAPPADLTRSISVALQASVTADSGATAAMDVVTEVYTTASTDDTPAWPSVLQTEWINQPGVASRPEASLAGSSHADDGSVVDYLFRSAGVRNAGFFSEPEQYSVDYHGQAVAWKAGNEIYSLSPLTTRPQFGSGAAYAYDSGDAWSGGAFAMRSRESASVENQTGAYAGFQTDTDFSFTLNALEKEEGTLQAFAGQHSSTVSTTASYAGGSSLEGQVEVGVSPLRPAGAEGRPFAERLQLDGHPDGTKFSLTAENYGAAFFGALRKAEVVDANVTRAISPTLDFHTEDNFRSYSNAFSLPGEQEATNREATELAGLLWRPWASLEFTLDAQHADRTFDFSSRPTRYIENTVEVGVRRTFAHFTVATAVDGGSLEVREGQVDRNPVERTNSSVTWTPDPHHDVSVFVSTGNDPYSSVAARTHTVGASVHALVAPHLTVAVQGGENVYDSREATRRSYVYGETRYELPGHQSIGLRTTWSGKAPLTNSGIAFALTYTRPLNLPAPALSPRCKVTGTLTDAATGEPIRRVVVVLNGRTAVTDNRGRYAFTQLKPGSYTLAVDPGSLGADRLIREALPLSVHLARGEAQQIALSAESAGRVLVQFVSNSADFPGAAAATVAGLLVHLVREEDGVVLSELTNEQGLAAFNTVRPGKWRMKVDPAYLPARYEATLTDSLVNVAGAATQQVQVAMKYQAPEIRWVASN